MIVCIGAFDGYHRGHFSLFDRARKLARELGTEWKPVTFEPHPRFVLGGLKARLFTPAEKAFLRANFDIPEPLEIPFTREFAAVEPGSFLDELRARLTLDGIVVGSDFRFGRGRAGDGAFLSRYCAEHQLKFSLVPQLTEADEPISSTRVRAFVENGDLEAASSLLGYPFFISSAVEHGEQRGRTLGYPTANLLPGESKLLPGEGVYAGAAWDDGRWYAAAVSVGRNPTFLASGNMRVEAHLLDFSKDLYGRQLFLTLLCRLRPMIRFASGDELAVQLAHDCEQSKEIFAGAATQIVTFRQSSLEHFAG